MDWVFNRLANYFQQPQLICLLWAVIFAINLSGYVYHLMSIAVLQNTIWAISDRSVSNGDGAPETLASVILSSGTVTITITTRAL